MLNTFACCVQVSLEVIAVAPFAPTSAQAMACVALMVRAFATLCSLVTIAQ
jgi:hypothetical protein